MTRTIAGFDWDHGNWPKCGKHGVGKAEIEGLFQAAPMVLKDRYPEEVESRFNAVGRTQAGRHLFVVFTLREKDGNTLIRPLSARRMHRKEIEKYERTRQG
ncbi:BrnT family toxin [Jiella pelagia]|uniref:BrnT family toxin n=1 Tax=Jiella pelagia TaxID=2986949 RepID=A0ABY7C3J4_9HYPH|nr:BrnT family toxin [Jiella pelagia]WAP69900.1 BrnT family toxin [Jiella pelagia]